MTMSVESTAMETPQTALRSEIAEDVSLGLCEHPKWLSAKLFYDDEGSRLFEEITRLPEYYLTRTEAAILRQHAGEMIELAANGSAEPIKLVELGAGSASKTTIILEAASRTQTHVEYFPIDVSSAALDEAGTRLRSLLPQVRVKPLHLDYDSGMSEVHKIAGRKLVLFIGSSIGNFEPFEASSILASLRRNLAPGDAVLLGTDMRKSSRILIPAYDDARGVTAAFNKNILMRINRELGADFNLQQFVHRARWNAKLSRIEMHLESITRQCVAIPDLDRSFYFAKGETIHTENSYKFTPPMLESVIANAGLVREQTWMDRRKWFSVHLLRAAESE
ncbi:MAG: L-histidine N(alpha)-methyltransferase [Acidobacteriaceae bacterium]